jgi:hypothetical protein
MIKVIIIIIIIILDQDLLINILEQISEELNPNDGGGSLHKI